MININPANHQEIESFLEDQWTTEDQHHYGDVEWQDLPFVFKAEEDGQIVGTIMGRLQSGVVLIDDVIVDRNHRGHGIGKLLVKKVESFAIQNQAHKIWGYTGKGWPSVNFYQSLGYQVIGELPNHYHKTDFVIISKDLT